MFFLSYEISKNKRSNYFEKMRITIEVGEKTVVMKRKVDDDDSTNRKSLNFSFLMAFFRRTFVLFPFNVSSSINFALCDPRNWNNKSLTIADNLLNKYC